MRTTRSTRFVGVRKRIHRIGRIRRIRQARTCRVRYGDRLGSVMMIWIPASRPMLRDGAATRRLIEEELTRSVIGAFFDVYNTLGYGFLEHVYNLALERELLARGHRVGREASVNIAYKGAILTSQRLDFVVDEKLVVESKSTQNLPAFAARQLYNYLRATNLAVGLLLHFGPEPKFHRLISPRALHK